jgi:hypothetical protein
LRTISLAVVALLAAGAVAASGHRFTASNPVWKTECGSCHVAYPPNLLSAPAWKRIIAGLDHHFGTDASLDRALVAEIERFLVSNASRRSETGAGAEPRITETPWFRNEHDEVAYALWRSPAVKSAANCGACHTQAEQGDYSERTLQLPK